MDASLTQEWEAVLRGVASIKSTEGLITIGPTVEERWAATGELRLVRLPLENDRLQNKWIEQRSGRFEWRDIPIITKRSAL